MLPVHSFAEKGWSKMRNNLVEKLKFDSLGSIKASISIVELCMAAANRIESLESDLKESEAARSDIGKKVAAVQKELYEVKSELKQVEAVREAELANYRQVTKALHDNGFDDLNMLLVAYNQVKAEAALAGKDGDDDA